MLMGYSNSFFVATGCFSVLRLVFILLYEIRKEVMFRNIFFRRGLVQACATYPKTWGRKYQIINAALPTYIYVYNHFMYNFETGIGEEVKGLGFCIGIPAEEERSFEVFPCHLRRSYRDAHLLITINIMINITILI